MALEYPDNLQYLDSHEYIRLEDDIAVIGISAHAVSELGDIVFLELPVVGDTVEKGESFGTVESVKAVEELRSPVTGTVVDRNSDIVDAPEQLGDDPYGDGWLIKVRLDDPSELDDALSAAEYRAQVEGED
ncbi:glycine cleavage system protein GcvH [Geitlerinema sp. PCC 7407]|uniref:glycine cleavage system protein GcvH n=1 Tax=Geitlerinema sp. PCC 7407 TaxID=1173025 RepID=UPI00029FE1DE|nr:glycine cleavage system protein GcvH [Geitlerinema sp. PCC 7407]AFY65571.1 glycine cleavage system H protein [Geitlerinema sp. PCC 7407]